MATCPPSADPTQKSEAKRRRRSAAQATRPGTSARRTPPAAPRHGPPPRGRRPAPRRARSGPPRAVRRRTTPSRGCPSSPGWRARCRSGRRRSATPSPARWASTHSRQPPDGGQQRPHLGGVSPPVVGVGERADEQRGRVDGAVVERRQHAARRGRGSPAAPRGGSSRAAPRSPGRRPRPAAGPAPATSRATSAGVHRRQQPGRPQRVPPEQGEEPRAAGGQEPVARRRAAAGPRGR